VKAFLRPRRCFPVVFALYLLALVGGCRYGPDTTTAPRDLEARAEDLLQLGDANGAINAYRKLLESAGAPEVKARAQIGIARGFLKLGNPRKSLDALYAARTLSDIGPLKETIDRVFGEASFLNGDYGIARNYLERSLSTASGSERAVVLAKLYVCAKKTCDVKAADRYLADIPRPLPAEAVAVIRRSQEPEGPARPMAPRPQVTRPTQAPPVPETETPGGPKQVIPRGGWGASPVILGRIDPMGKISRITIHHTGGPTFWGHSAADTAYEIRKIQRVHQSENRWADIGYHFIIDRVGRVWQGRPLVYQGAHAHGTANRGNIGIVVLGNYMQQDMSPAQIRTLRNLVLQLSEEYGIPPSRIYTHGEIRHGLTDCPGPAVARVVQSLRRNMSASRHAD
jgi:hypothetical protein